MELPTDVQKVLGSAVLLMFTQLISYKPGIFFRFSDSKVLALNHDALLTWIIYPLQVGMAALKVRGLLATLPVHVINTI